LQGAGVDAKSMFAALTDSEKGEYDKYNSLLLLDPSKQRIIEAIADLAYDDAVDTFTFFFAGHGGLKNEAFALCGSDTNCDRLIATALPITQIFQILNDAQPRHSNIIIDACHAAGMVADFGSLLKPSQLGKAQSASISIFATSAADRGAKETDNGGVGTRYVLDCIEGRKDCRVAKEHLSLDDIGAAVGAEFGDQSPSVWSFNVSGASQFVRNPIASSDQADFVSLPEFGSSVLPTIDQAKSEQLWRLYIDASEEIVIRALQGQIESVVRDLDDSEDQAGLILGLSESFSSRGASSDDSFASLEILCAFLLATQAINETTVRDEVADYLIVQIDSGLSNVLDEVLDALAVEYGLLSKRGSYGEFYTLPIRISKVAAWALVYVKLAEGVEREIAKRKDVASSILLRLTEQYFESFSLMSEAQAPYLLIISELARKFGLSDWSEEYLSILYANYFYVGRKIAKVDLPSENVLSFLRWRCGDDNLDNAQFVAKPSELLFVLLYHFYASDQLDVIKYDFEEVDHAIVNAFIPDNYENFGSEMIYDGTNIHFHIGLDLFTAKDFSEFMTDHLNPAVERAASESGEAVLWRALIASIIYPNRVPWFLAKLRR
jgi:hypothetical protein